MAPTTPPDDGEDETTVSTWDGTEPVTIAMVQQRKAELEAMYAALSGHEVVKITVALM